MNGIADLSRISRVAGAAYLLIFVTGIFANFAVLERLVVPDAPAATAERFAQSATLFRLALLSFVIMVGCDLFVAWALYLLLRPVHPELSLFSAWLRLIHATLFAVALVGLFAILQRVEAPAGAVSPEVGDGQVMLWLGIFDSLWRLGLIFFAVHLALLGYLIAVSGTHPNLLGILLLISAAGYLVDSLAGLLLPAYASLQALFAAIVIVPAILGELSLAVWMLWKPDRFQAVPVPVAS